MKRKVAKVGPSTLMISLPSKWCRENAVKRGEELSVEVDQNKNLVVGRGQPAPQSKEIQVDLSKFPHSPRHVIAAAYKTGYDKVIAKYSTERERKDVEKILTYSCLGYSILEETKDNLIIKDIAEIHETEFAPVLKKMFFLTGEIARNALAYAKSGEEDRLDELIYQRRTLHKYADFCRRVINKRWPISYPYPASIYDLIRSIEVLTGNYRSFCFTLSGKEHVWEEHYYLEEHRYLQLLQPRRKRKNLKPKNLQFLEKINQQVYSLTHLFYSLKMENIDEFQHRNCLLMEEVGRMIKTTKKSNEIVELSFFLMIVKELKDMRWDLLDLSLG